MTVQDADLAGVSVVAGDVELSITVEILLVC